MLTDLFRLDGLPAQVLPSAMPSMSPGDVVANVAFQPGNWPMQRQAIRGVKFNNVDMSNNTFQQLTFNGCHFEDCLFKTSIFREVEFHNCTFANCNFWKAKFEQCYLDPTTISFAKRFKVEAANVGVTLYQSLLSNYDNERQDTFFADADYRFRQWKRYQLSWDIRKQHIGPWQGRWEYFRSLAYEWTAGFGYKPVRFFMVTLCLFLAVSCLNYVLIGESVSVGGQHTTHMSFVDSIYYSFSILTVLGFSSIVPNTAFAKLLTVCEALAAIGWLGIFTSIVVKRVLR